ncbi:MAG TPA: DUF11 domain-containing protein [Chloroflexi bacterium]|nr:DUF11 domain-containing protein [Chloroflexota bacterium]
MQHHHSFRITAILGIGLLLALLLTMQALGADTTASNAIPPQNSPPLLISASGTISDLIFFGSKATAKVTPPPPPPTPLPQVVSLSVETFRGGGKPDGPVVNHGDRVYQFFKAEVSGSGTVDFRWNPFPSFAPRVKALDIEFVSHQPEPGGPPFFFKNLTPEQARRGIVVSFRVQHSGPWNQPAGGSTMFSVKVGEEILKMADTDFMVNPPTSVPNAAWLHVMSDKRAADTVETVWWRVQSGIERGDTLSPDVCRELVAQGQSANRFMVWRLPAAGLLTATQSYTLPVVYQEPFSPKLILVSNGPPSFVYLEMPLEVRANAMAWANENLPHADDEIWVAFGLRSDVSISCPDFGPRAGYTLVTDVTFDLSTEPQAGEHAVLQSFQCDRTALTPPAFTCVGEGATQLVDMTAGNWFFEPNTVALTLKPGDPLALHYWLENGADAAQTFTLSPTSSMSGAVWTIYPGYASDPLQPDLDHPLGAQVTVPAHSVSHLHIRATAPTTIPVGAYVYTLTVSSATAAPPAWVGSTDLLVTADGALPAPLPPAPAVDLSGRASAATVRAGETITYHLTIANIGALPLTDLVLTNTLPAQTSYLACGGGDSCTRDGDLVIWRLANLGAGGSHAMMVAVQTPADANPGAVIANTTYRVTTAEQVAADGAPITSTIGAQGDLFLPLVTRE